MKFVCKLNFNKLSSKLYQIFILDDYINFTAVNVLSMSFWPHMASSVKPEATNELAFPFISERAQQPLATNIKIQHM